MSGVVVWTGAQASNVPTFRTFQRMGNDIRMSGKNSVQAKVAESDFHPCFVFEFYSVYSVFKIYSQIS